MVSFRCLQHDNDCEEELGFGRLNLTVGFFLRSRVFEFLSICEFVNLRRGDCIGTVFFYPGLERSEASASSA